MRRARLTIPLSVAGAEALPEGAARPVIVSPPIDPSAPDDAPAERERLAVAYVSDPKAKGLDVAVAGWAAAAVEGARLEVYGLDPDWARSHLRRTGVAEPDSVELRGTVPAAQFRERLRRARVFVHGARWEDWGQAPLEALADGALLATVPAGGPYEAPARGAQAGGCAGGRPGRSGRRSPARSARPSSCPTSACAGIPRAGGGAAAPVSLRRGAGDRGERAAAGAARLATRPLRRGEGRRVRARGRPVNGVRAESCRYAPCHQTRTHRSSTDALRRSAQHDRTACDATPAPSPARRKRRQRRRAKPHHPQHRPLPRLDVRLERVALRDRAAARRQPLAQVGLAHQPRSADTICPRSSGSITIAFSPSTATSPTAPARRDAISGSPAAAPSRSVTPNGS